MDMPKILLISFARGFLALVDEVRRTPTGLVFIMLVVVIVGTLAATLAH